MRRRSLCTTLLVALTTTLGAAQSAPSSRDTSGQWFLTLTLELGTATPELTLKQDGDKLTGTYKGRYGEFPVTGQIKGRAIHFTFLMRADSTPAEICFEGELAPDAHTMSGTADMADIGHGTWTASRTKAP
jgi:hypothetical protein